MLIKQLEIILSEKMNSQSTVNYATGIMNDFFHSIGFVGPLPQNLHKLMEKVEEKFPAGTFQSLEVLINMDVAVHVNNLLKINVHFYIYFAN